jgi:2-oxoacid:acceptor oxidoreductase delta subunit (pyruvate/2-ketoisovalerate family)
LPGKILDREIQRIVDQGVKIQFNQKVTVQELEGEYGAILVAVGSHLGVKGNFNHGDLILDGIKFLRDFKLNQKNPGIGRGDRVAIIGGGNTAVDVARTALRLGAIPTIYYRRTMKEMPAIAQEVEEALAEGVYISFLTAPNCIRRSGHGDMELELNKMELGEPDASGRRRPVPIPDSARIIEVDHVISAIGQKMDNFVFKSKQVTPVQGKIIWNGSPHVFTAGDMAWGGTVAEAIGSGNKVAGEIHASLHNLPYDHETTVPEVVLPEDINFSYYLPTPRHNGEIYHSTDFYRDFTEVNGGLHEMEVVEEAGRCLHCGECYQCGNCFNYCPDAAIFIDDEGRLRIDYDYCKGCGICLEECPCSAIEIDLSAVKTSTV